MVFSPAVSATVLPLTLAVIQPGLLLTVLDRPEAAVAVTVFVPPASP